MIMKLRINSFTILFLGQIYSLRSCGNWYLCIRWLYNYNQLAMLAEMQHLVMSSTNVRNIRLQRFRSTSALLLIGSTIRKFSMGSALWVLEVLCCLYWRISYLIDHSMFWWMDVAVNWSTLCQECRRTVFWARCCSFSTPRNFFPFWRTS